MLNCLLCIFILFLYIPVVTSGLNPVVPSGGRRAFDPVEASANGRGGDKAFAHTPSCSRRLEALWKRAAWKVV